MALAVVTTPVTTVFYKPMHYSHVLCLYRHIIIIIIIISTSSSSSSSSSISNTLMSFVFLLIFLRSDSVSSIHYNLHIPFFSLLRVCLSVTSLQSLCTIHSCNKPMPFQYTYYNYSYNIWRYESFINFFIPFCSPMTTFLCWFTYFSDHFKVIPILFVGVYNSAP
jgi:hypothetical protein